MSDADFNEIVSSIYRTVEDTGRWSEVMGTVAREVGGDKGVIYSHGLTREDGGLWVVRDIEDAAIDRYVRHFSACDTWRLTAEARGLMDGKVRTGDQVVPRQDLYRTEWYNDFTRPLGLDQLVHFVQPVTMGGFTPTIHFSVYGDGKRPFDEHTVRKLERYKPHLQQALLLRSLVDERVRVASAQTLVRALLDPALLVDRNLRILAVNDGAAALLRTGFLLRAERDILAAPPAKPDLTYALGDILRAGDSAQPHSIATQDGGRGACIYNLSPVSLDWAPGRRRDHVLIAVRQQRQREADVELLSRLFGLTPAEVRVARELVAGEQVRSISEKLGVAQETVRTHVKHVLGKTGCRRQGDLIRLVWSNFVLR